MPETKQVPKQVPGKTVRQPTRLVNNIKAFLALHPEFAKEIGYDIGEFYLNAALRQAREKIPKEYWCIIWRDLPYPEGKIPLENGEKRGV